MPTLSEILEALRHRAEQYTADAVDTRRPSWGPALVVNEEFVRHARIVGLLKDDDKPIIPLCAKFADPREHVGLTLAGVRCRGFEVCVGMEHKGERTFWAKRGEDASWEHGPHFWQEKESYELFRLRAEAANQKCMCENFARAINECGGPEQQPNMVRDLERMQQACADLEQKYQPARVELDARNNARTRLIELSRERVIEFGGGDHLTQMIAGARACGHCCICGKQLTDSVSVERGIGPDCYSKHSTAIDAWVAGKAAA